MKALILAAGLGTRLRPFTERTPKPLFPVNGRPVLDMIIDKLVKAGCHDIMVNTHHLHTALEDHITARQYPIPVSTSYEEVILGTGGAIKKVADFWDDHPFFVINSDIIMDIDLAAVFDYHRSHPYWVTMVMHHYPEFNNVVISADRFISAFRNTVDPDDPNCLAFTGIQVMDPSILDYIPDGCYYSIIDAYRELLSAQQKIKAFVIKNRQWHDIGTPKRYRDAAFSVMAPNAFQKAFPGRPDAPVRQTRLKGDGSDRTWYRLFKADCSMVMADHGIYNEDPTGEAEAFISIGRHLSGRGLPVPHIFLADAFSGLVFMEDLGDENLQTRVRQAGHVKEILRCYRQIVRDLANMSQWGLRHFDPAWAYQTTHYSREVILDKECHYFMDAFLDGYLEYPVDMEAYQEEFETLADRLLHFSIEGFMHRDFQSRNIMCRADRFYFIDFQGGRIGPIQYDLASLLIDPYVDLPYPIQQQLVDECMACLSDHLTFDRDHFYRGYALCSVTRNLQALGAFGFLSRVKGKTWFEQYIPTAVRSLRRNLDVVAEQFPKLRALAEALPV
jgi:aminoglycoside/choline kinase family phosphotransferase/UTP-glucose-1-phosphate uridylyltransferase